MNMNPWHVDQLAELNRQRVRDEVRQIRLEESVAPVHSPSGDLLLNGAGESFAPTA